MPYYELLGLTREPFSNSPDPVFFYSSRNHARCLHLLEIAVRLRRGLNVCLGAIGVGKSTLCRALLQELAADPSVTTHLLLDPAFSTPHEFLATLHDRLVGPPAPSATHRELMEAIKSRLFHEAREKDRLVLLIVDEGQKLSIPCLEVIRELLNYETNDAKLLQVIIFAQEEFAAALAQIPNFRDRINELCRLASLDEKETRDLIRHRLRLAGGGGELFTRFAYRAMFQITRGHPRKIMHLGHKVLLALIMNDQRTANRKTVLACARAQGYPHPPSPLPARMLGAILLFLLLLTPSGLHNHGFEKPTASLTGRDAPGLPLSDEFRAAVNFTPHPDQEHAPRDTGSLETAPGQSSGQAASTPHVEEQPFPSSRYYVQTGGFLTRSAAEAHLADLRPTHPRAGMIQAEYKEKHWNIVFTDVFPAAAQAAQQAFTLQEQGVKAVVIEITPAGRYRPVPEK